MRMKKQSGADGRMPDLELRHDRARQRREDRMDEVVAEARGEICVHIGLRMVT